MKELIQSIKHNDGTFPRKELLQIIERKEEAIPLLLQILKDVRDDYTIITEDMRRIDFTYAYYLLAQFRVQEAFPLLIELLSLPGYIADELFGDSIAEDMGRILASTYNGDLPLLYSLIENEEADEYARGQGLVAMVALVHEGTFSREFVLEYFKQLMTDKLTESSYYFNSEIVSCSNDLYPEEVYPEIERLYDEDMLDPGMIDLDSVKETLAKSKEMAIQSYRYRYELLTDTIKEMEYWGCFQLKEKLDTQSLLSSVSKMVSHPPVTVVKIGRNDPCPCGSGKKYKKCCGG